VQGSLVSQGGKNNFLIKSRRAMGEFDQGEVGAFAIGYWSFEGKCIPDNKTNRECVLVSKGFDTDAIIDRAGGVIASKANALGGEHPPTEGPLSNHCWY
jgi:hypothetical protein